MAARHNAPMRVWVVYDSYGGEHGVEAQFCFNNGGEGLIFRRYPPRSDKTEVVACFAAGSWKYYREITHDE